MIFFLIIFERFWCPEYSITKQQRKFKKWRQRTKVTENIFIGVLELKVLGLQLRQSTLTMYVGDTNIFNKTAVNHTCVVLKVRENEADIK